MNDIDLCLGVV